MSWLRWGRRRAEAAVLREQVTALQAALAKCKSVTRRPGARRWLTAGGAALLLALGFVLGVNSGPLEQWLTDRVVALGFANRVTNTDAGYAAYQKGDLAGAVRLLQPAAEQGDARAQSLLGMIHYTGRGPLRNDTEALKWSRLAAGHGDAAAQFRLGLMHSEGHGVPQDHAEAAHWYRLAAQSGYAQAQYNLGLLHAAGEGVPQDNVMAHVWFNLAAAQFPESDTRNRSAAIRSRDVVASKLTPEQLAQAQRLAREWKPVRWASSRG
jgi:hypothetical protein